MARYSEEHRDKLAPNDPPDIQPEEVEWDINYQKPSKE